MWDGMPTTLDEVESIMCENKGRTSALTVPVTIDPQPSLSIVPRYNYHGDASGRGRFRFFLKRHTQPSKQRYASSITIASCIPDVPNIADIYTTT